MLKSALYKQTSRHLIYCSLVPHLLKAHEDLCRKSWTRWFWCGIRRSSLARECRTECSWCWLLLLMIIILCRGRMDTTQDVQLGYTSCQSTADFATCRSVLVGRLTWHTASCKWATACAECHIVCCHGTQKADAVSRSYCATCTVAWKAQSECSSIGTDLFLKLSCYSRKSSIALTTTTTTVMLICVVVDTTLVLQASLLLLLLALLLLC